MSDRHEHDAEHAGGHGHGDGHGHDAGHGHDHGHGHSHGHGHGHGHSHAPSHEALTAGDEAGRRARQALLVALALNASFLVIEAAVGWWTGSLALLSDAAHMLSDVGALLLAFGCAQLALGSATGERSFGLRRAEPLGAFVNGITLLLASGWIIWEAVHRLIDGATEIAGLPVLVVGVIGLLINLGSAWWLARADSGNLNIRGALIHMLADALGSVGAIVAALFVMAGQPLADPIVSLFIAALVLWGTWGLLRDSVRVLLQFAPPHLDIAALRKTVAAVPGVEGVHDLHVWSLDGQRPILSAHVEVEASETMDSLRLEVLRRLAEEHGVRHATLQMESTGTCGGMNCEERAS